MRNKRILPSIKLLATEYITRNLADGDERRKAFIKEQREVNRQVAKANEEYVKRKVWRNVN